MQICDKHWQMVRNKIDEHGMAHLVCQSAEAANDVIRDAVDNGGTFQRYDPLLACNIMLIEAAVQCGGLGLLAIQSDGSVVCPVCEAMKHCGENESPESMEEEWTEGPVLRALDQCRERGLVPAEQ